MLPSNTIYIKIYINRVHIRNIDDQKEIELTTTTPFTSERLLIGNFTVIQSLIKKGLKIVMGKKFFPPIFLMHPIEKVEGGLSQVEERVIKDLAVLAGAQKGVLWLGHELNDKEVLQKINQNQEMNE